MKVNKEMQYSFFYTGIHNKLNDQSIGIQNIFFVLQCMLFFTILFLKIEHH